MDLDILTRKLSMKGFMFPNVSEGKRLFKMIKLDDKDYTIDSTSLEKSPTYITITRFVPSEDKKFREETVTEIICKTLNDVDGAIKEIVLLEEGKPHSPFDMILTGKNMTFRYKKGWVIKTGLFG